MVELNTSCFQKYVFFNHVSKLYGHPALVALYTAHKATRLSTVQPVLRDHSKWSLTGGL